MKETTLGVGPLILGHCREVPQRIRTGCPTICRQTSRRSDGISSCADGCLTCGSCCRRRMSPEPASFAPSRRRLRRLRSVRYRTQLARRCRCSQSRLRSGSDLQLPRSPPGSRGAPLPRGPLSSRLLDTQFPRPRMGGSRGNHAPRCGFWRELSSGPRSIRSGSLGWTRFLSCRNPRASRAPSRAGELRSGSSSEASFRGARATLHFTGQEAQPDWDSAWRCEPGHRPKAPGRVSARASCVATDRERSAPGSNPPMRSRLLSPRYVMLRRQVSQAAFHPRRCQAQSVRNRMRSSR
jgi:hypothetical protein